MTARCHIIQIEALERAVKALTERVEALEGGEPAAGLPYTIEHKGFGRWAVTGPDAPEATMGKDNAQMLADELNGREAAA